MMKDLVFIGTIDNIEYTHILELTPDEAYIWYLAFRKEIKTFLSISDLDDDIVKNMLSDVSRIFHMPCSAFPFSREY